MNMIRRLGGLLLLVAFAVACHDQQPDPTGMAAPELQVSGLGNNLTLDVSEAPVAVSEASIELTSAPFVGSYAVSQGPLWSSPGVQAYSCVEACSIVFGGQASDYACSTTAAGVNNLAWASSWGSPQHCSNGPPGPPGSPLPPGPVPDIFKVGGPTLCGGYYCYISAYVKDHCSITDSPSHPYYSVNYCFLRVITVDLDIKPGSDPNSINCTNEKGVIAVAILTTADFDATTVDHTTVTFEGASETHVDNKTGDPRRHEEDVDGDGDIDLVFHFRYGDTGLTCVSTEGMLTGETYDGTPIEGTDAVRMVPEL